MPKVGRNELCPCGSGIKYKECHGCGVSKAQEIDKVIARAEAREIQRQRQQVLGKPIISSQFEGQRVRGVTKDAELLKLDRIIFLQERRPRRRYLAIFVISI